MHSYEELFGLARMLRGVVESAQSETFTKPLDALEKAVAEVGKAFSGSWLGYHSRVYYENLQPPPPGAQFSQEWGLMDTRISFGSTTGDWEEFRPEIVEARIEDLAGHPDLTFPREIVQRATKLFSSAKADALSILEGELAEKSDAFLEKLKHEIEDLTTVSPADVRRHVSPGARQIISRDMTAIGQGTTVPPHIRPYSEVVSLRNAVVVCDAAADTITKAASHLERQSRRRKAAERVGTNVFIGHGRSLDLA